MEKENSLYFSIGCLSPEEAKMNRHDCLKSIGRSSKIITSSLSKPVITTGTVILNGSKFIFKFIEEGNKKIAYFKNANYTAKFTYVKRGAKLVCTGIILCLNIFTGIKEPPSNDLQSSKPEIICSSYKHDSVSLGHNHYNRHYDRYSKFGPKAKAISKLQQLRAAKAPKAGKRVSVSPSKPAR